MFTIVYNLSYFIKILIKFLNIFIFDQNNVSKLRRQILVSRIKEIPSQKLCRKLLKVNHQSSKYAKEIWCFISNK